MHRGGKPYYSYKDTVMSKLSPFRPEWIEELVVKEWGIYGLIYIESPVFIIATFFLPFSI